MNAIALLGFVPVEVDGLEDHAVTLKSRTGDGLRVLLVRAGLTPDELEAVIDRIVARMVDEFVDEISR